MAWRSSSFSRTLLNSARSASLRSATNASAAPRLRPSHLRPPRRLQFTNLRTLTELGCIPSMLPMLRSSSSTRLTSYAVVDVRAFCELSQGT